MLKIYEIKNTEYYTNTDIISAKNTIKREIENLRILEEEINNSLTKTLDIMKNTTGKIIVTSIGESGIIARKIVASLSTTETPSFFVHQAEASHGDLRRNLTSNTLNEKVENLMIRNPKAITKDILASEAIRIMNKNKIINLFVLHKDKKTIDIIHIYDLLKNEVA